MRFAIWQKLDRLTRLFMPLVLSFLLVILSVVQTPIPGHAQIFPVLALASIYHWVIYQPNLLPLFSVFILGLLQDLLTGTPVGLYTLVFLTVYGVALSQRRFLIGKSFIMYWFGFGVISLMASVESWMLASIWNWALLDFTALAFQFIISVSMFPPLAWVCLRWQQAFLPQDL